MDTTKQAAAEAPIQGNQVYGGAPNIANLVSRLISTQTKKQPAALTLYLREPLAVLSTTDYSEKNRKTK
jgi:hypothetical protein